MNTEQDFAGKDSFIWFTGIVEDRQDPLKLGRCKVRCVGWHSDNKMNMPTSGLPWAVSLFPTNNTSTYAPREGDMVFGFFMDGEACQNPVILGVFPSIPLKEANVKNAFEDDRSPDNLKTAPRYPKKKTYKTDGTGLVKEESDTGVSYPNKERLDEPSSSRLARNDTETIDKTFIKERKDNVVTGVQTATGSWSEPVTQYGAKYPYNNVQESESGHILEFDDTPGKERVHMAHRSGTFFELYPDGDKVEKIVKDNYQITMKDDNVYIMGKCNITVQGDSNIYVKKNVNLKVGGNVVGTISGNFTGTVGGSLSMTVSGSISMRSGSSMSLSSGGTMTLSAPRINLN